MSTAAVPLHYATARRPSTSALIAAVLAVLAMAVALTLRPPFGRASGQAASTVAPTSAAMEATWGVRFTQIGISADGGMVDVRYVVIDADKAAALATSVQTTPGLVEESSHRVVYAVAMRSHVHDVKVGGRYYLLYRDTAGLLKPGNRVSITLPGAQLRHVVVLGSR